MLPGSREVSRKATVLLSRPAREAPDVCDVPLRGRFSAPAKPKGFGVNEGKGGTETALLRLWEHWARLDFFAFDLQVPFPLPPGLHNCPKVPCGGSCLTGFPGQRVGVDAPQSEHKSREV